jgi:hypothetical protein
MTLGGAVHQSDKNFASDFIVPLSTASLHVQLVDSLPTAVIRVEPHRFTSTGDSRPLWRTGIGADIEMDSGSQTPRPTPENSSDGPSSTRPIEVAVCMKTQWI